MDNYLRDRQYKDKAIERPGTIHDNKLVQDPEHADGVIMRCSWNGDCESHIACLPLSLQTQKPSWPKWGVVGHNPIATIPISHLNDGALHCNESFSKHIPIPSKLFNEGDDWLSTPNPREYALSAHNKIAK
eukprot:CAMPEP_0196576700 /NCGR_PEP_ID=MMETSP1081-20130531/5903_1 /TAXON_ID=36882 /ORGANISM="Pyramimonas amylifera, Strain CCMP720" /LENGTH=130 /DNA_ID=CAMNT_0041895383 /DNA_START=440 /DNA_END=832 /DNA_ORIENTATION=+